MAIKKMIKKVATKAADGVSKLSELIRIFKIKELIRIIKIKELSEFIRIRRIRELSE